VRSQSDGFRISSPAWHINSARWPAVFRQQTHSIRLENSSKFLSHEPEAREQGAVSRGAGRESRHQAAGANEGHAWRSEARDGASGSPPAQLGFWRRHDRRVHGEGGRVGGGEESEGGREGGAPRVLGTQLSFAFCVVIDLSREMGSH
jgi:hypothetical protein